MKMCDSIDCPYTEKCVSYKQRCSSCVYNRNARRDYYSPLPGPYWPWYPNYPWYDHVVWCTSNGTAMQTNKCDYYTSNNSDVPVSC